ncbi:MAG: hypothetical protein JW955_22500 [Sedimentisphaerales bacterium]|nr:hypothetical protein [Sedimentisphaerales bacterium]
MLLVLAAMLPAGCGIGSERKDSRDLKVEALEQEKAQIAARAEHCQVENAQLQEQLKAMAALPKDGPESFYKLTDVKISRYTSFYDQDQDGKREKLLVYIQPIDTDGDIVKAAGVVSVELWNLDNPADQALIGQWQVQPAELHKLWVSGLVSNYRLPFRVSVTPEMLAQPLTVKITFTDYLTGETFRNQRMVKVRPE